MYRLARQQIPVWIHANTNLHFTASTIKVMFHAVVMEPKIAGALPEVLF